METVEVELPCFWPQMPRDQDGIQDGAPKNM